MKKSGRTAIWVVAGTIMALLFSAKSIARVLTDYWWFGSTGYESVFTKTLTVSLGLGVGVGLLTAVVVYISATLAIKRCSDLPAIRYIDTPGGQRVPVGFSPEVLGRFVAGGAILLGVMHGLWGSSNWATVLQYINSAPFGISDPILEHEAAFYVFDVPFYEFMRSAFMAIIVFSAGAAGLVYIARGALGLERSLMNGRPVVRGVTLAPFVRAHAALLAGLALVGVSIGHLLSRYMLMHNSHGLVAGPTYSDVYGRIPLETAGALSALVAAGFISAGILSSKKRFLFIGIGALVAAGVASSVYPSLLQKFKVLPNELRLEAPFIQHHIKATRTAYQLDKIEEMSLSGEQLLTMKDIEANKATIQNVRLWDYGPLLDTFSQLQEIRPYYNFVSVDNDRYMIDGEQRQIMLSAREIRPEDLPDQAQTWVNTTMTYTHGYGITLGPVNEVTSEGLPALFVKDLPPQISHPDDIQIDRPELYYGESMDHPVFVNTQHEEFDYPTGEESNYTMYSGTGGVSVGSFGSKVAMALRLETLMILLSTDFTEESRVLLYRNISTRIERIAPFLKFDRDPYMAVVDGRLLWIADAYTVTDRFPYSAPTGRIGNYIANSVKVTVDAYDGNIVFYAMDETEPILATWMATFPGMFQPKEEISPSLWAHLRTAKDLFEIQAINLASYHMTDTQIFYNREDEWEVPTVDRSRMAPYYTIMKLPGEQSEEFILMLPFVPKSKPNLAAWMVGRSDGEHYGKTRVYKFPKDKMVYGPNMIVARINQDDLISEKLSLWNQRGSSVVLGTLLVIPIEESLIYIQPLYIRADVGSIPELKRVIVGYQNQIAMEPTLDGALEQIFGEHTDSNPIRTKPTKPTKPTAVASNGDTPQESAANTPTTRARTSYQKALEAAENGDWTAFGVALDALGEAIEDLPRPAAEEGE